MDRDLERCLEAINERDEQMAESVIRLDGMTVALDSRLPLVWDANYVRLDRPGLSVDAIIAAADKAIGGAGMDHRTIVDPDGAYGGALAAELERRGWMADPGVIMIRRRDPDRAGAHHVDEVRQDDVDAVRREFLTADLSHWLGPGHVTAERLDQLAVWDRQIGAIGGDRWFVARHDGRAASFCRLLEYDGVAQVEDVGTLEFARGRGLARAVVLAAVEASRAAGNEVTFLIADANDWPRQLYEGLGFDAIGAETTFYLPPNTTERP